MTHELRPNADVLAMSSQLADAPYTTSFQCSFHFTVPASARRTCAIWRSPGMI